MNRKSAAQPKQHHSKLKRRLTIMFYILQSLRVNCMS